MNKAFAKFMPPLSNQVDPAPLSQPATKPERRQPRSKNGTPEQDSPPPAQRLRGRRLKKGTAGGREYEYIVKGWRVLPAAAQQFEALKADLGRTGMSLLAEALNDLFEKYNKQQIA
jgi:hypothetical protein